MTRSECAKKQRRTENIRAHKTFHLKSSFNFHYDSPSCLNSRLKLTLFTVKVFLHPSLLLYSNHWEFHLNYISSAAQKTLLHSFIHSFTLKPRLTINMKTEKALSSSEGFLVALVRKQAAVTMTTTKEQVSKHTHTHLVIVSQSHKLFFRFPLYKNSSSKHCTFLNFIRHHDCFLWWIKQQFFFLMSHSMSKQIHVPRTACFVPLKKYTSTHLSVLPKLLWPTDHDGR